jgi:hypothetical protein
MRSTSLGLRKGDRERLGEWVRSTSIRSGLAQRARIVLLAADGMNNTEIAARVGVSRPTVIGWRKRMSGAGWPACPTRLVRGVHAHWITTAPDVEGVTTTHLDLDLIDEMRRRYPLLHQRRPDLYGEIAAL